MERFKSRLQIVTAAVMWGIIGLLYNGLTALGFQAAEVVFLRVLCAALAMTVVVLIKDPTLFCIRLRDIWMFVGSGVVSLAFFNFCYFNAMEQMDLAVAATLLYTAPVFVMLLSALLFRESFTVRKGIAVGATFIGCLLITGALSGGSVSLPGILFGLGSGIGYALYTIFGVVALKSYRSETITLYTFWLALFGILPLCRVSEMVDIAVRAPLDTTIWTLAIGILSCLLPYVLYTKGLEHTPPSEAAIMATIEPVVAAVVGWIWLDDSVSVAKVGGMILIIGSVVLINIPFHKKSTDS